MGLLACSPARAAENWLDVSTTSVHINAEQSYNRNNFGLGVERRWGELFVMAGRYNNSLGTPSRYAMLGYTPVHVLGADVGLVAGALDGYATMRNGHAFAAAGGVMRWSGRDWGAQLLFLPPIKGSVRYDPDGGKWERHATPAAIGLQLQRRF
jgi:hypothetical protein